MTVSFQGAVGPFDAAVIKSDDSIELKKWLTDNEYVVSDAAVGLIDVYVRENKYFVALKLLNGVGVRSIQPIVLTFRGTEACVPLRLTAIAANPDMPVLVWVLGDEAGRAARLLRDQDRRGPHRLAARRQQLLRPATGSSAWRPTRPAATRSSPNTRACRPSPARRSTPTARSTLTTLRMAMTPPVYVQAADLDGSGQRSADAAAAGEVHPDARRGQGDGRHRVAVLRQHQLLLGPVRVPGLRPARA